ncbi:hypothetical protein WN55_03071 [Dufourea novaeangliae]|uniref:Uncharacterized protein n=1 Tax=Dufourea novaeangliae TaxID=178035 RepID=A0A154PI71_DUFNO|nr:hypothetical protein WN55_03071 [Dufourea novaeangliae]
MSNPSRAPFKKDQEDGPILSSGMQNVRRSLCQGPVAVHYSEIDLSRIRDRHQNVQQIFPADGRTVVTA